jgi:hypothetical protein
MNKNTVKYDEDVLTSYGQGYAAGVRDAQNNVNLKPGYQALDGFSQAHGPECPECDACEESASPWTEPDGVNPNDAPLPDHPYPTQPNFLSHSSTKAKIDLVARIVAELLTNGAVYLEIEEVEDGVYVVASESIVRVE